LKLEGRLAKSSLTLIVWQKRARRVAIFPQQVMKCY